MKRYFSVTLLTLSALAFLLGGTVRQTAAADYTKDEAAYIGKMLVLSSLYGDCLEAMAESTTAYDGSEANRIDIIASARCLVMLDKPVQEIEAPERFADTDASMKAAATHFRKSGEYLEAGMLSSDPDYITMATDELTQGTDDLADVNDKLDLAK